MEGKEFQLGADAFAGPIRAEEEVVELDRKIRIILVREITEVVESPWRVR